jgi:CRISPR-associated endoribonuclease Cas6
LYPKTGFGKESFKALSANILNRVSKVKKEIDVRVSITAETPQPVFIPFNYNYALHAAIYRIIQKSSTDYSQYLHDQGFANDAVNRRFKLFTFSRLFFTPANRTKTGFRQVRQIRFIFSTPMEASFEHLVLGLFSDQVMHLNLSGKDVPFAITQVEALPEPMFNNTCRFVCLSPIAVSTQREKPDGQPEQHFLDYMNPAERDHFIDNIQKNLIHKFQTFYNDPAPELEFGFTFSFDPAYIARKQGKISKLIHFKKITHSQTTKIKGFEAPFTITADPRLIKIGYEAGFGNDNSAGLGCVDFSG